MVSRTWQAPRRVRAFGLVLQDSVALRGLVGQRGLRGGAASGGRGELPLGRLAHGHAAALRRGGGRRAGAAPAGRRGGGARRRGRQRGPRRWLPPLGAALRGADGRSGVRAGAAGRGRSPQHSPGIPCLLI